MFELSINVESDNDINSSRLLLEFLPRGNELQILDRNRVAISLRSAIDELVAEWGRDPPCYHSIRDRFTNDIENLRLD